MNAPDNDNAANPDNGDAANPDIAPVTDNASAGVAVPSATEEMPSAAEPSSSAAEAVREIVGENHAVPFVVGADSYLSDKSEKSEKSDKSDKPNSFAPDTQEAVLPLAFAPELRVLVVGVGDGGSNIVARLNLTSFPSVARAVVNTDKAALVRSPVTQRVQIGETVTRGLGTGGEISSGTRAAEASKAVLAKLVEGCDLVIIVTSLGGGTGGGSAPVLAKVATAAGALTIAFVTQPFSWEGPRKISNSSTGFTQLRLNCAAAILLPNDLLHQGINADAGPEQAFHLGDLWIERSIAALCSMLFNDAGPRVDMATLRKNFPHRDGKSLFSLGHGEGEHALENAYEELRKSPLLSMREMRVASMIVISIRCGPRQSLDEVQKIIAKIGDVFGGAEHRSVGIATDPALGDAVEICIIGTSGGIRLPTHGTKIPTPTPPAASAPSPELPAPPPEASPTAPAPQPAQPPKAADAAGTQVPLPLDEDMPANFFRGADTGLVGGQNLDVPTFIRQRVRVESDYADAMKLLQQRQRRAAA